MKRVIILISLLLTACTSMPEPVTIPPMPLKPMIFDGDTAHEDMFAALFLLQHPNVDLKAITVVEHTACRGWKTCVGSLPWLGGKGFPLPVGGRCQTNGKKLSM